MWQERGSPHLLVLILQTTLCLHKWTPLCWNWQFWVSVPNEQDLFEGRGSVPLYIQCLVQAQAFRRLLFFFFLFLNLFLAVLGLSCCSSLQCNGFSLQWLLLFWSMGYRCVVFSSHGTWTYYPWGMWDLPRLGIKPMSSALAGRFLTTGPPGKSPEVLNK